MKDPNISAMSYTSKDFGQIYKEALDLAKELTNRWDPSQSNESDPGVVLLKEGAFLTDHNNYNIDKNVLENFLPSATQDRSVRNIMEMNGYTPRYYVSAMGKVSFKWENPNATKGDYSGTSFTIPRFTLVVSDADGTVSYTQADDLAISIDYENPSSASLVSSCNFIEGTLQTLTINNSDTVFLENIDDNNRVYLPETMVAQNGVYIRYSNDSEHKEYGFWERNNYLSTQPAGSRLYKIDYDSFKGLPYIEFPSDISNIILSGLLVQYISTSGEAGNVSANTLVNIVTPTEFYDRDGYSRSTEYLTLNNVSAITNGKDPETIEEMYQSFKKVVGTFDTLVSCNDYKNKINLLDDGVNYLVSNNYVTDRRTDYNKSANVVTFDSKGVYQANLSIKPCSLRLKGSADECTSIGDMYYDSVSKKLKVKIGVTEDNFESCDTINLNDFSLLTEAMTPYDLVVYALKNFSLSDYNRSYPYRALQNSFTPISSSVRNDLENLNYGYLSDSKCICHTFNDPKSGEVYCFKNYVPLNVTIIPYNKITADEKSNIINNIYIALSENFNPRNIEFGEDLDITAAKEVILNSDSRIKDCNIDYKYETYAMNSISGSDGIYEEKKLNGTLTGSSSVLLLDLVTKNILAGRVCLFEFDEDFTYDYEQSDCKFIDNATSFKTALPLPLKQSAVKSVTTAKTTTTTSVIDGSSSGYTIYYNFNAPNLDSPESRVNVTKGTSYTLQTDEDGVYVDSFRLEIIQGTGTESKVISDVTYKASLDTTYSFSLDDANIINTADDTLTSITGKLTIVTIRVDASDDEGTENLNYTLDKNEYIQILYPNYYSTDTYGIYVNYRYQSTDPDSIIRANTEHTLRSDEKLVLVYTNNGVTVTDVPVTGTIIRSSFDINQTDKLSATGTKKSWTDLDGTYHDNEKFMSLSSNQTISKRSQFSTILNGTNINCYWMVNNSTNTLFSNKGLSEERVLGNNEYFIYTNSTKDEMMILGSGTKLLKSSNDKNNWIIDKDTTQTIESITTNGITSSIPWSVMDFSQAPFEIVEMNFITLSEGDSIKISGWEGLKSGDKINNSWVYCNGTIAYTSGGTTTILPKVSNFYKIRSRLDLVCGPTTPQEIIYRGTDGINQEVHINSTALSGYKIQSSIQLNLLGDENIDVSVYTQNGISINILGYKTEEKMTAVLTPDGLDPINLTPGRSVNIDYNKSYPNRKQTYTYTYPFYYFNSAEHVREYLVPVYIEGDEINLNAKMQKKSGEDSWEDIYFIDYNVDTSSVLSKTLTGNNMYFLSPSTSGGTTPLVYTGELRLVLTWEFPESFTGMKNLQTLIVDDLTVIKGINNKLSIDITNINKTNILSRINGIISGSDKPSTKFYYSYRPDSSMEINLDKYLSYTINNNQIVYEMKAFDNPLIMWDTNNVANKMTIAQLDLANSRIDTDSNMVV